MSNAAVQKFMQADEDHGMDVVVPKGRYRVEVMRVHRVAHSANTTAIAPTLELRIVDGKLANRRIFVDHWLVNPFDPEKEGSRFYNMSSTFLRVLGVTPTEVDASANGVDIQEAAEAFYNFPSWSGARFVADIGVETAEKQAERAKADGRTLRDPRDRNRLSGWHRWTEVDADATTTRDAGAPAQAW